MQWFTAVTIYGNYKIILYIVVGQCAGDVLSSGCSILCIVISTGGDNSGYKPYIYNIHTIALASDII